LLEASCAKLLSGWVALVNVLATFTMPFVDPEVQRNYLVDALTLLSSSVRGVEMNGEVANAISDCLFRLVRAICRNSSQTLPIDELKPKLAPIVSVLLDCLTLPGYSRCYRFKMDVYGALLCVFDTCAGGTDENAPSAITEEERVLKRSLAGILDTSGMRRTISGTGTGPWSEAITKRTAEIINTISSDVTYAPFALKVAAMSCLANLLSESVDAENIAFQLSRSGTVRCILDSLVDVQEQLATKPTDTQDYRKALLYLHTVIALLLRLASTNIGWTALVDNAVLIHLGQMNVWTTPPKDTNLGALGKAAFVQWILSPMKTTVAFAGV
jgi:hypothetical protein